MPKVKLVSDEIEDEVVETKKKKSFAQSDGIMCKSVTHGALYISGIKTGMLYPFTDYGDESELEYRDLVAAVRARSNYIFNPNIIIEDEDFIAEFPALVKFYEEKYSVKDLKAILDLPINQMIDEIKKLPKGAANSLKSIAVDRISSGKLDSVKKIKALDEVFGTDLNLIGDIMNS